MKKETLVKRSRNEILDAFILNGKNTFVDDTKNGELEKLLGIVRFRGVQLSCAPLADYNNYLFHELYYDKGIRVCDEWQPENNGFENFKKWAYEEADPGYSDYYEEHPDLFEELKNIVKSKLSGVELEAEYTVDPNTGEIIE